MGKTIAEKLEMIWEADKGSKIEVAQRYGIPLSVQLNNKLCRGVMFQV
jgi:hypothetical protein